MKINRERLWNMNKYAVRAILEHGDGPLKETGGCLWQNLMKFDVLRV